MLLRKSPLVLQDFTTIGSVGSVGQQMAGHEFDHSGSYSEPGTLNAEVLAYYKFGSAGGAITDDNQGAYALTNNGTVTQAGGIFGSSIGAASFSGSNYFTQATLLDTPGSAIAIDFWFKATDGQPSSNLCLFSKVNDESGGTIDLIRFFNRTTGILEWETDANNVAKVITSTTVLPNGQTGWYYVCATIDTTNGMRLWVNGVLEAQDSTATTIMSAGTTRDFAIGSYMFSGPASFFNGQIAYFRVRNKVLDQHDVDVAYATKYTWPALTDMSLATAHLTPYVREGGDSDLMSQLSWAGMEAARKSNYIYRYGGLFGSTDQLRIVGRE